MSKQTENKEVVKKFQARAAGVSFANNGVQQNLTTKEKTGFTSK